MFSSWRAARNSISARAEDRTGGSVPLGHPYILDGSPRLGKSDGTQGYHYYDGSEKPRPRPGWLECPDVIIVPPSLTAVVADRLKGSGGQNDVVQGMAIRLHRAPIDPTLKATLVRESSYEPRMGELLLCAAFDGNGKLHKATDFLENPAPMPPQTASSGRSMLARLTSLVVGS